MNKPRKSRNYHAINAWNRHAGPMKDKKKEESRLNCRNYKEEEMHDYCDFCGEYGSLTAYFNENNQVFYVCQDSEACDNRTFWQHIPPKKEN